MKMFIKQIDNMVLIGGIVTEYREGTKNAEGRVVNIKLKGKEWNGKEEVDKVVEVAFWNSNDADKPQLADNVKKAGLSVGQFITVLAIPRDDKDKYTALRFQYSGRWHFPATENRKEYNIFVGTVSTVNKYDGRTYISMTSKEYDPTTGEYDTVWHGITFWNNDKSKLADNAAKCFVVRKDGKKPKAVVIAGENKPYEGYNNYTGYSFRMLPEEAYA